MSDNVPPNRKPRREGPAFCRDQELEQNVREFIEENYRDLALISPFLGEAIRKQPEALAAGVADAVAQFEFLLLMSFLWVLCPIGRRPGVKGEIGRKKEQL